MNGRRRRYLLGLFLSAALAIPLAVLPTEEASALPAGFSQSTVFRGLSNPTVLKFSADGRIFVAEKNGRIKVFDNLSDTTATTVANLSTEVHNFWDRGLLGMALHPNFPITPYIYVLYTADAAIGDTAPRWGTAGALSDPCPTPPGATADGCIVSSRLSRLEISGDTMVGPEVVMINDWCQQYPSHSAGAISFGNDGMLYASGGEGASFTFTDYGQDGQPVNPCGDPGGASPTAPTAEGGALRSQDVRTLGDPQGLSGTVIRVDPITGDGVPGNPLFSSADANARRIVATGLRNPFRIVHRPGSDDVFIGDVGASTWEEINRVSSPTDGSLRNFGWPCYEGPNKQVQFDALNLNLCENLYQAGSSAVTAPFFAYRHTDNVTANDGCTPGSSSLSGVAFEFYSGTAYPPAYLGALFFADYSRGCIWVMMPGVSGDPDPTNIQPFVTPAAGPVNLEMSPAGELFYPAFTAGEIRRIIYNSSPPDCSTGQYVAEYFNSETPGTVPALARCEATIDNDWGAGAPNAEVNEDGWSARWTGAHEFSAGTYEFTATSDAGMRVYVDGTLLIDNWVAHTETVDKRTRTLSAGLHDVRVEYFDDVGSAVAKLSWAEANSAQAPTPTIDTPAPGTTWQVDGNLTFSGSATDPQDGTLPASALTWELTMQHCPSNCHAHVVESWTDVASGSFTAPDHEYPSYLDLKLTATDADGNSASVVRKLDPATVNLTFQSNPAGRQLTVGGVAGTAPFTRTVIIGSTNSISANTPQTSGTTTYNFASWSDGGAQSHNITAPTAAQTYTATYNATTPAVYNPYARINFQPAGTPLFSGYLADTGAVYGARNGLTYGWNATNSSTTRDRNSTRSADQRYDTLIHTQLGGSYKWELAVPNGTYRVRMVCGDPDFYNSVHRYNVEGVRACNAAPTSSSRWITVTVTVSVTDGRITVTNAPSGATGNKLNFLDIDRRQ